VWLRYDVSLVQHLLPRGSTQARIIIYRRIYIFRKHRLPHRPPHTKNNTRPPGPLAPSTMSGPWTEVVSRRRRTSHFPHNPALPTPTPPKRLPKIPTKTKFSRLATTLARLKTHRPCQRRRFRVLALSLVLWKGRFDGGYH
jgi:hypothetical protein